MEELPLSKLYNYAALAVKKTLHHNFEQKMNHTNEFPVVCETGLVGLEIEVEGLTNGQPYPEYYWHGKEDHSLRNHGYEYASIPLRGYQIEKALLYLNQLITNTGVTPQFSNRCSVHVHLNVRDMTWEQVRTLVLLYSIFEKHFFHIAGTKRENNIFCVPLYKCDLKHGITQLEYYIENWQKYCAINLGPILGSQDVGRFGTIEFRHLYGTLDTKTIIDWVNNLFKLRLAAVNNSFADMWEKVINLNSTSEYIQLYKDVFGEYADLNKMLKYDFESCITTTKEWELANSTYAGNAIQTGSALYNTYQQQKNLNKAVDKTIGIPTHIKMAKAPIATKYKINWNELIGPTIVENEIQPVKYDEFDPVQELINAAKPAIKPEAIQKVEW